MTMVSEPATATRRDACVIAPGDFDQLLRALAKRGYSLVGPTIRDGAIVYDSIESTSDLPVGWTDEQTPGKYRLKRAAHPTLFGYAVGPQSWKKFLSPPVMRLWQARKSDGSFDIIKPEPTETPKLALIGVRSCELRAIAIQDKVFLGSGTTEPIYQARREQVFIVAVHCTSPNGTCFCVSMNAGPRASGDFDIALTEVAGEGAHYLIAEAGTGRGDEVLKDVKRRTATEKERDAADRELDAAAGRMGRQMDTDGIKELLYENSESPRWQAIATRCLTCANCTMVCPTCFCHTIEDTTDLTGEIAERWRKWDSCFTIPFTYIHGGSVRYSGAARYRQWLTHKLASWHDQFGSSGCVGCGRCITWCPVGIDLTEEVRAIREADRIQKEV